MANAKAVHHRRFGNVRPLPSGRFQARWMGPDGHRHLAPETFATEDDANAWLAKTEVELAEGTHVDRRKSGQPFRRSAEAWTTRRAAAGYRESTVTRDLEYVARYVRPRWDDVALDAITPDDIETWYLELTETAGLGADGRGLSPATVHKVGQLFAKVLDLAVRAGNLRANPARGVPLPRDPDPAPMQFLTPAQIQDLADAMAETKWADLVTVAAWTGLRIGEVFALRARDVDTERRRIHVAERVVEVNGRRHVGAPKTKAGRRTVPYPKILALPIARRLAETEHPDELLFPNSQADYQGLSGWRSRVWVPAVAAAGLDGLRIHDLRHTAVSLWIAAGKDPKTVAAWAGHRSVVTVLDRYGHLYDYDDDDPTAELDALEARRRRTTATVTALR